MGWIGGVDGEVPAGRAGAGAQARRCRNGVVASLVVLAAAGLLGCVRPDVVRVVDGEPVTGRYIEPAAYAAYSRGALAEAQGAPEQALEAFVRAADIDDDSVEIWTRVAALQCRLGQGTAAAASFASAERIEPRYEPLWRARAECARRSGDLEAALQAARRAVGLDPSRLDTALLVATYLEEAGEQRRALRWHAAVALSWPDSSVAWQRLEQFCARAGDPSCHAWARRRGAALASRRARGSREQVGVRVRSPPEPGWRAIDQALRSGDLEGARSLTRRAHLDIRQLAARAIALGQPGLAQRQASELLAADPADTDSRLSAALGADLRGDTARLTELCMVPAHAMSPSAAGRLLLAELLRRHVDEFAAQTWLRAAEQRWGPPASDAVTGDLLRRLEERLGSDGTNGPPATRR